MTLFHLFLICMAVFWLYLLLVRVPVYRYINDNWNQDRVFAYYRREDYWVLVGFGFVGTLWLVTTVNLYYKFLY